LGNLLIMGVTKQRELVRCADFETFHKRLLLGCKQVERIESATASLIKHLVRELGLDAGEVFLQGSYANGTAIKPDPDQNDGEYDVDLVVICANADETPERAVAQLRKGIAENGTYAMMIEDDDRDRPCVRLRYTEEEIGGFHVDVVAARRKGGDSPPLEIPRLGVGWCGTDPEGYRRWCEHQGDEFARTVQMLKRWRDHNQSARDAVKSIVLQVLISETMPDVDNDADRIAGTLCRIADFLAGFPESPPRICNPVVPGENLTERWPLEDYKDFRSVVAGAASLAGKAVHADTDPSRDAWIKLFGGDFPATASPGARSGLDPGEMDLELDLGIPTAITSTAPITGHVTQRPGFRGGPIGHLSPLQKHRQLYFKLRGTDVAPPYDVYWKVKNTGEEARQANGLRGEIVEDRAGPRASRSETTLYAGPHYVEIYIVKRGVCVAKSRIDVPIA
jgi:predicted nucleotidyltransferase